MSNVDRNRTAFSQIDTPHDDDEDALQKYGHVSNTFDHARDPLISKQRNDEIADRRDQNEAGENSWMISKEQPRFINRPPEHIGKPENAKHFAERLARDDKIARSRVKLTFETEAKPKQSANDLHAEDQYSAALEENAENQDTLDEIADEYGLDFEHDDYHSSNAQKQGQSQS